MQSTSWETGLEEAQAGIKVAGRNINNLRYAGDNTLMAESKEGLKSLLMKAMATHSSTLAWRIPWTEEPGGLQSIGSHRVGHNWSNLACPHTCRTPECFSYICPGVQMVKNLPAIQETQVKSLGREDPMEEETAIHSSILTWRIPWTESLVGYSPWGHKKSDTT